MKKLAKYLVISVLGLMTTSVFAQTTVTGHIFAEVVESVSASSLSQTSFTIQKNNSEDIEFGQIEVNSSSSASCSLILGKANLTSNNNQLLAMETSASSLKNMFGNAINGSQVINLKCMSKDSQLDQNASNYQGNINIDLAYN